LNVFYFLAASCGELGPAEIKMYFLGNDSDIAGFEIDSLPILANDVSNLAISNAVLQFPW
jgi:hypothetical protein